jgi:hypothetical protein
MAQHCDSDNQKYVIRIMLDRFDNMDLEYLMVPEKLRHHDPHKISDQPVFFREDVYRKQIDVETNASAISRTIWRAYPFIVRERLKNYSIFETLRLVAHRSQSCRTTSR